MPGWIESIFAFFFKYRPAVFAKGDLVFGAPTSVVLFLVAAALIGVPAVLTYAAVRGKSSRRDRWVLGSLRVAALLVLIVCLFRPMLLLSAAVPQRNFVGVLVDDSRSMGIADVGGKPRSAAALDVLGGPDSGVIKQLKEKFQVRLFRFGGSAQRIDSASQLGFKEQETHVGDAIERGRQELDAVPLSGLVVISDGADNSGAPLTDQLLALRARSIPVFTVGIGSEQFDHDIEVQRVQVPHKVLKGAAISADLLIRQRGYQGKRVPL
ncbi:MAG TPA: hypothetical protein VMH39_03310, partial [Gemmatimonadaceae bacterium]|nr:hypothetical protein [Gemmatimonadaceae bacterium]